MSSEFMGDEELVLDGKTKIALTKVLACPDVTENLISISKLTDSGKIVQFHRDHWKLLSPDGTIEFEGPREYNMYVAYSSPQGTHKTFSAAVKRSPSLRDYLYDQSVLVEITNGIWKASQVTDGAFIASGKLSEGESVLLHGKTINGLESKVSDVELWHKKLGHLNLADIKKLASQKVIPGLTPDSFDQSIQHLQCEHCIVGKMVTRTFSSGKARRATRKGQIFYREWSNIKRGQKYYNNGSNLNSIGCLNISNLNYEDLLSLS
jgi:hypothetical protein